MIQLRQVSLTQEILRAGRTALYRGTRDTDGAPVLVNALASDGAGPRDIARMMHEHAMASALDLDCVVKPIDLVAYEGGLAVVLSDPGGRTLYEAMQGDRLGIEAALWIAGGIARALQELHHHHVIHKDIQPRHVLVDSAARRVWLTGFGLATRLSQEPQRWGSSDALESALAYASPEQTGRMNRPVDQRSDLYSLGVVFYEMLTAALPFQSTDPLELVHSHIARRPVPPHERSGDVPAAVSDIVMKLLAKTAEERYRSAGGVARDVGECLARWEATGSVAPFPLGQHDESRELCIPQKLYGRERELATLMDSFARARRGGAELLLVRGPSGAGKSALVHEVHKAIAQAGGYFAGGKFDQLNRSVPYAPLVRAASDLVRYVGTERAEALSTWKAALLHAIGPHGWVLTELIPELSRLVGPQTAPELAGVDTESRFMPAFHGLLRAFMTPERPLVLFLDDLQWADTGSLKLLDLLLTAPDRRDLLVIGAYRDSEVDAGHPLLRFINEMKEHACVSEIAVPPLDRDDVLELVADALGGERGTEPLADLIFSKTEGNPFFTIQLLTRIFKEGLLQWSADEGAWRWDAGAILERTAAESVVAFMGQRIRRLALATQRVLGLAACIGHRFDLTTLAMIRDASPVDTAAELWEALQEGIVVPLDPAYRFLQGRVDGMPPEAHGAQALDVEYRFAHDRAHEAAYALVEDGQKPAVHLRIGRSLLARSGGDPDEEIFDVVGHMNLAVALITDPRERLQLARLNLAAGKRARKSGAHQTAADILACGMSLLGPSSWEQEYELSFSIHLERAECELGAGRYDEVEHLIEILSSAPTTELERARVASLRVTLFAARNRPDDAVRVGIEGLRTLGIDLLDAEQERKAMLDAQIAEVQRSLEGRRIEDLVDAPALTDPGRREALRLLVNMGGPAYINTPNLFALIVVNQLSIALSYGHSEGLPFAYMRYGFMLSTGLGRHAEAQAFGKLALALNEKLKGHDMVCRLSFLFAAFAHAFMPLRSVLTYFDRAYRAGMESRDVVYLSYTCSQRIIARLGAGDTLGSVREEAETFLSLMQRMRIRTSAATLTIALQMIANLEGRTPRDTLSDAGFDERDFLASIEREGFSFASGWYYVVKLELAFLYGRHDEALEMLARAKQRVDAGGSFYYTTELLYYGCLALVSLLPAEAGSPARAALDADVEKLAGWAESCPENYLQKRLLVQAELARAAHRDADAMELYDEAIEAARRHVCVRDEAMANELCARFYERKGRVKVARAYMADAIQAYARWGATAKVADLSKRYSDDLEGLEQALARKAADAAATNEPLAADRLDIGAVIGTLQALSGELVLDKLIDRVMRILIHVAGADRGFMVRSRDGELFIEAAITPDASEVLVRPAVQLGDASDLATTIVRYVARFGEAVVLDDATGDLRFAADPYISARRPRSIACLPMTHQGQLKGVLYIENDLVQGAFTRERADLLGLLSSQAATAVENSLLYEQVKRMSHELMDMNAALERTVAQRTAELSFANAKLKRELDERERAEAERARLQEEILRVHAARLAELSTPVIPITDRITVIPVIGKMDEDRTRQLIEVTLEQVHARGSAVVILDVTGVKQVDADFARALAAVAGGLRLLGAEAVITGVSAAMAQALIELGTDHPRMVTKGTLQGGFAYATARVKAVPRAG